MKEEDPFDYEAEDVSCIIRPSIQEMVANVQWLDQVQDKQQKELEKEIRAKQARTAHEEFFSAERCLICTLVMGTCEHTRAWTRQHQEEVFLQQQIENERLFRSENALESELNETLDKDVLSRDHDNMLQPISGTDEIALEHMAWLPLEERAVDKIDSKDAKLSSPNDRIWHSSILLDGFIVVFGGLKTHDGRNPLLDTTTELVYLNDIKAYDLSTQAWKTLHITQYNTNHTSDNSKGNTISIPAARYGHGAAAITKDSFIIFGGRGMRGKIFHDTWLFDLRNGSWQCLDDSIQLTSFASPPGRFFTACCSDLEVLPTSEAEDAGDEAEIAEDKCSSYQRRYILNNRSRRCVYLFGGTNGNDNFNDLWRFRLHYKEETIEETNNNSSSDDNREEKEDLSVEKDDNLIEKDYEFNEEQVSKLKKQYDDPDEIEMNVKLDEQLSVTERLTMLLQRTEPLTQSLNENNTSNKENNRSNKIRSKQRKIALTVMGHWERCVATGDTPAARYGHSLCLLTRPLQPSGIYNHTMNNNNFIYNNKKQSEDTEEEKFVLVLGGCHVSPEREVSVGSEASAQDTTILLSLATRLQQAYAQENLTSVLATHQLRQLLIQEITDVATNLDNNNMKMGRDTADALTHWLQQAGNVSRLLSLKERDTRFAEQVLVDAFKLYKATLKWQMTGRHMTHAARHSQTHLDIHWLRLPPPAARVSRHISSMKKNYLNNNKYNNNDFEGDDTCATAGDTQEGDAVYLQWEVSQHGRVMGLSGSGKYRPSARMHFGACVLQHQQEARFLLVVGGIEPTSLTFLTPTTPATPVLGGSTTTTSNTTSGQKSSKRELSVFVLDLRTMVWTLPSAVNAFHYKEQTLAVAKAEYLRAKLHLQSLETTAMALLGRSKHYLAATTSQHNKNNTNLDDILEIRQARVFQEVCRWRLHTLQQSLNTRHINNNNNIENISLITEGSYNNINNNNNNAFQFVPGKKIVSLLDSKAKKHKLTNNNHIIHANNVSNISEIDNNTTNNNFQHQDLYEGYGGFAATRLGQRLILVGGVHFADHIDPYINNNNDSNSINNTKNYNNTSIYSDDSTIEDGTKVSRGFTSISETRLRHALSPPCVMVLDMEALSVKQTRWRRNYYASLELYRKQEEAKLQMDALISLHAIREAQRIETETLLRENRFMSIEDYLSHIPPLSQPGAVSLFNHRRSVHSIWVFWEDLVQVAQKTLKRQRATQTRHRNMFIHDTNNNTNIDNKVKRSFSMEMDIATATALLKRLRDNNNNNTNIVTKSKINPDYLYNNTTNDIDNNTKTKDVESETDFSSLSILSSAAANLTYFLYAQIGFENLQPGDIVDVLPKEVKRPNISKRPYFVNNSTGDLEDSFEHRYEDCDLYFDDTTPRHRGVLLKASVFSAKPGYFTVKYLDKSLETHVSRHRIRRIFRPSPENNNTPSESDIAINNNNNNSDHYDIDWQLQLNLQNVSSISTDNKSNYDNKNETAHSLITKNPTNKYPRLPTVLPDPRIWTLVYAGPETQYAVTHLLPRHIQETETQLKIGVMFCVQSQGMDTPEYERSQLSHPVIIHTSPTNNDFANSNIDNNNGNNVGETQYMGGAGSVMSQLYAANDTNININTNIINNTVNIAVNNDTTNINTMSRTKKQVISAVIQARHLCPAESLPVTHQDTDDIAGLYKTRRIALVEPAPAPTDLLLTQDTHAPHPISSLTTIALNPANLAVDERHETVDMVTVKIATQDNYVWGEGQGDDYA